MNSMNSTLPQIPMRESMTERQSTRTSSWEANFENNHIPFAEKLAHGIAQHVLEKLAESIKDPYKKTISSQNKLVFDISLEMTRSRTAKKISDFTQGGENLPPFDAWIAKFSVDEKESDDYYENSTRKIDEKYFKNLMAIVGQAAAKKLNNLLIDYTSNPNQKDLQFTAQWSRHAEKSFSDSSDFRDNCLHIELWFDEKTFPNEIEEISSPAIEQYKTKQKLLQKNRNRVNLVASGVFILFGLIFISIFGVPGKRY